MAVTVERPVRTGFAAWFTQRPIWYLVGLAVAVNAVLFGVGPAPLLRVAASLMHDPFAPMDVQGNLEPASPLMWIVAHWFGISTTAGVALLNLTALIGVLVASAYLLARWVSDFAGRLFVAAWFASPLANVQLTWLGKPDHLTMFGAVLLAGPPGACFAGGLLLGFNHFEQGVVIVAGTVLMRLVYRVEPRRWIGFIFGGFAAGRLLWMMYAAAADYHADTRLAYIREAGVGSFFSAWRGDIPTLLFSVFGVLWLPVALMFRDSTVRQRWVCVAVFAAATAATLVTSDLTRVYALVTLPILISCVAWFDRVDRAMVLRWLPWLLLAAVIVPRVVMWGDNRYVSSWERFI